MGTTLLDKIYYVKQKKAPDFTSSAFIIDIQRLFFVIFNNF